MLFIESNTGKLGIGTITPAEMLDVDGNAIIRGNVSAVEHQMQDSVGVVKAVMKYSETSKSVKFTFA
jgi:ethanolamine utilization microcompartment shell protein EutS